MMTYGELTRALSNVLRRGAIGTPVSLRLFLHLPEPDADLDVAVATLMRLVEIVFPGEAADLAARLDSSERQLNVLIRTSDGRTVSLSVVRGGTAAVPMNLLLIGNRGIVRFEGADSVLPFAAEDVAEEADHWKRRIKAARLSANPSEV